MVEKAAGSTFTLNAPVRTGAWSPPEKDDFQKNIVRAGRDKTPHPLRFH